jgi:hypothetical protein
MQKGTGAPQSNNRTYNPAFRYGCGYVSGAPDDRRNDRGASPQLASNSRRRKQASV